MEIIQMIGYILYAILLFITVVWAYGIRIKPVVYPTILTGFYFLVALLVFSLSAINKIHLIWVIPFIYIVSFINVFLIQVPTISIPLKIICDIYASIIRIGKKRNP